MVIDLHLYSASLVYFPLKALHITFTPATQGTHPPIRGNYKLIHIHTLIARSNLGSSILPKNSDMWTGRAGIRTPDLLISGGGGPEPQPPAYFYIFHLELSTCMEAGLDNTPNGYICSTSVRR